MKVGVILILVIMVALLFNLLGFLFKIGYAPFADEVLVAGAALEILGALVLLLLGKPAGGKSNKLPLALLASALLAGLCYLFLGQLFFYNETKLEEAWQHREMQYPRQWIAHLGDLEFEEFGDRMTTFATTANFCYGYLDTEKGHLAKIPRKEQLVIRHNCLLVNKLYLKSKLFQDQCVSYEKSLFIQKKYFSSSVLLSKADSLAIEAALDSIASQ
jgi:hypothetical protein